MKNDIGYVLELPIDWIYQEALGQAPDYRVENLLEAAKLIQTLTL